MDKDIMNHISEGVVMSDLISRSWLVEALESSGIADSEEDGWVHSFVMSMIADAPTVEAKPVVKGNWIKVTNGRGGHECSNCHEYAPSYQSGNEHLSFFCPNCGARMADMRGEKNEMQ